MIASIAGRTLVAHNARFDTQFLDHEFDRAGVGARPPTPSLCTMQLSSSYLYGASRKLKDCCAAARVVHLDEHTALGDARAFAGLLRYYLSQAGVPVPWASILESTRNHWWPTLQASLSSTYRPVSRTATARQPDAWLDRITSALPRNPDPEVEAYLDVLEKAMLDGYLSAHEESALMSLRISWPPARPTDCAPCDLPRLHGHRRVGRRDRDRFRSCGPPQGRGHAGTAGQPRTGRTQTRRETGGTSRNGEFKLRVGDQVVFTGELSIPRDRLIDLAEQIGLRHGGVNRNTKVVVAADPDSQSGKAAKARSYGIPVITEAAFARMLDDID